MKDLIEWLSFYPIATYILIALIGFSITILFLIYLVAFFQGREISIWPPKIGGKPQNKSGAETTLFLRHSPDIIVDFEGYYYIIENGSRFHIPDPQTFEYLGKYFGFKWSDAKSVGEDEAKKLNTGRPLPSILPHCSKDNNELIIHRAIYGSKNMMSDVTHHVRKKVSAGKLDVTVSNDFLGDPAHGQGKKIVVVYSYGGEVDSAEVEESGKLILPIID